MRIKLRPPVIEDFLVKLAASVTEKIKALLAISLKAGKLAAGYSAVLDALDKGRVELLLYARDLSKGTKEKITIPESKSIRNATLFTRDEFGRMLNRDLVGVIAILDKGLADALWIETQRLKGLIILNE